MPILSRPWFDPLPEGLTVTYTDTPSGVVFSAPGLAPTFKLSDLVDQYQALDPGAPLNQWSPPVTQATLDAAIEEALTENFDDEINAAVTAQVNSALATKADASTVSTLSTTVGNKADSSTVSALSTTVTNLSTTVSGKASQASVDSLTTTVNGKADSSTVTSLTTTVSGKADASTVATLSTTVTNLNTTVTGKAAQSALDALSTTVSSKADTTTVNALATTVAGKVDAVDITAMETAIAGKADASTVNNKIDKDTLFINLADHGISSSNTYDVNQAALVALFNAAPVNGAVYYYNAGGIILIDGGIDVPPNVTIQLSSPSGRYWGYNNVSPPPSPSAFQIRSGSTASYAFRFVDNFLGVSTRDFANVCLKDFTLLGNSQGSNMVGLLFAATTLEQSFKAHNVRIVGMSGSGVSTGSSGKMWVHEWINPYIGGCGGYGVSVEGTSQLADCWFHGGIITGCVKGGMSIDSTGSSGQLHVTGLMRIERSNWHPTNNTFVSSSWYGAPGLRIRGNLSKSSFSITTDANSGPGISVVRVSGRTIHSLKFTGLLSRDGFYDMTTGASGNTNPQAGIEIVGFSGGSVDNMNLTGLTIVGGYPIDGGTTPYYCPAIGAKLDSVSYLQWPDINIDASIATPLSLGSLGTFRCMMAGKAGGASGYGSILIIPVCPTASRPGTASQPPAILGMMVYDTTLNKPVWYKGGTSPGPWVDATGTTA